MLFLMPNRVSLDLNEARDILECRWFAGVQNRRTGRQKRMTIQR